MLDVFKQFAKTSRFWIMWVGAVLVLLWYVLTDPNGGNETLSRLQWLAWFFVIPLPVYYIRKSLMQGANSRQFAAKALESPVGAGLVYLGLSLVTAALVLALSSLARG
jgi:hypothetical protein